MRTKYRMHAAILLPLFIALPGAFGDMKAKVEMHYSLVGAPPGIASESENILIFYAKGSLRRKDEFTGSALQSAILRNCDTGNGFHVDFDHAEYWELNPIRYSNSVPAAQPIERATSSHSGKAPTVTVRSRTTESKKTQVFFGQVAHYFETAVTEFLGDSDGSPYAEEDIAGWYWPEVRSLSDSCMPDNLARQPSAWIGEPSLVVGALPLFRHSGPSPAGLAVEETRTVRSGPSNADNRWQSVTTVESKVLEFSDRLLDNSIFLVPSSFKRIPNPQGQKQHSGAGAERRGR